MVDIKSLLHVDNLKTYFYTEHGISKAVDGVSFDIFSGETVGIVGESGCGKSITALSLLRLVDPPGEIVEGNIIFDGEDILSISKNELTRFRGSKASIIFQEPMTSLNPVISCGKQIFEAVKIHANINSSDAKARTLQLLELVRLPEPMKRYNDYPHELSGGMRQRVMIAMALASEPKLLIADEPTTALDVTVQAEIIDLLSDLQKKLKMAILFITHDIELIHRIADRILVMYSGQIVEEGLCKDVLQNPLHPYTKALLACSPSLNSTKVKLSTIPGTVPLANRFPSGCRFHPRCSIAKSDCSENSPELSALRNRSKIRCPFSS